MRTAAQTASAESKRFRRILLVSGVCLFSLISLFSLSPIGYATNSSSDPVDVHFEQAVLVNGTNAVSGGTARLTGSDAALDLSFGCPGEWAVYRFQVKNHSAEEVTLTGIRHSGLQSGDILVNCALPSLGETLQPLETCAFDVLVSWDPVSTIESVDSTFMVHLDYQSGDIQWIGDKDDPKGAKDVDGGDHTPPLTGEDTVAATVLAVVFVLSFTVLITIWLGRTKSLKQKSQ